MSWRQTTFAWGPGEILRQLARQKGSPLAPKANAGRILSLIKERRGDVSNRTIAKAVSNALLRRKAQGLPCSPIHYTFAFLGAPGTGKPSWARWLAREARNLADRVKLRLAARLAEREDCPKEELFRILPQDVEGAAAEILEEYRALERDGGRAIGFSGGKTGESNELLDNL